MSKLCIFFFSSTLFWKVLELDIFWSHLCTPTAVTASAIQNCCSASAPWLSHRSVANTSGPWVCFKHSLQKPAHHYFHGILHTFTPAWHEKKQCRAFHNLKMSVREVQHDSYRSIWGNHLGCSEAGMGCWCLWCWLWTNPAHVSQQKNGN